MYCYSRLPATTRESHQHISPPPSGGAELGSVQRRWLSWLNFDELPYCGTGRDGILTSLTPPMTAPEDALIWRFEDFAGATTHEREQKYEG